MNKENLAISCLKSGFIGDDGAILGRTVYSKDLFFEGSHFLRGWMSAEQIGYKAMMVNFSDTIAMGAEPKFVLLGLALPRNFSPEQIRSLSGGIKKACDEFGAVIIGGDTIGGERLCVSVSVVGEILKKPLLRKGVKNGDLVAFSGVLGGSLRGLKALLRGGFVSKNSKFIKPVLRDKFIRAASVAINGAMDISDGLADDLQKLSHECGLGFKFKKRLSQEQLKSGEEYEILFSFSPKNRHKIARLAQKTRTKITIFAKAQRGKFKANVKNHHF